MEKYRYYKFGKLVIRVSESAEFEFQDIKTGQWFPTDETELNAIGLLKEINKNEQS